MPDPTTICSWSSNCSGAQDECREAERRVWELVRAQSPELATLLLDFWKHDEAALARWLCTRRGEASPAELVERGRIKEVIAQVKWAASSAYI
ncbi:hypothetical protein [Cognatilysobacter terrigena]|uniref:hypothetical protein n=1 Tax=Cognatilysobacter terrigena TaxID=2488749 RepID=UPI001414FB66|nr:hypothetical protein [Lysobacter terrigena]